MILDDKFKWFNVWVYDEYFNFDWISVERVWLCQKIIITTLKHTLFWSGPAVTMTDKKQKIGSNSRKICVFEFNDSCKRLQFWVGTSS